jgi:hypothetical protein
VVLVTSLAIKIAKQEKASAARIKIIMEDAPIIVSFFKTVEVTAKIDYNNPNVVIFFTKMTTIILIFLLSDIYHPEKLIINFFY